MAPRLPPQELAPMPREVFTPNWGEMHKQILNKEHVYGKISIDFLDGNGQIDLWLVDGDKKVRISSMSCSPFKRPGQTDNVQNFAFDFTYALANFDKISNDARVVVESYDINNKEIKPRITVKKISIYKPKY
jgi:hypothetical protein